MFFLLKASAWEKAAGNGTARLAGINLLDKFLIL